MSGKCRDGVDLPDHGACHVCGAMEWQPCRGRAYAAYMKAKSLDEKRAHQPADIQRVIQRDMRRGELPSEEPTT